MEDIYFTAAVVAFALAACSFVASIIIFVRAGVPNAIRFLRHKPVKRGSKGGVAIPKAAPKKSRRRGAGDASAGDDRPTAPPGADRPTDAVATEEEASELPTGLLDGEESERPTGLLGTERPLGPTDYLGAEDSERPTGVLDVEDSERPAGLLDAEESERPTGVLDAEDSERPTGLLDGKRRSTDYLASERPTAVLVEPADRSRESAQASIVAQHEETTFRFILKHNEVVVHTQETID